MKSEKKQLKADIKKFEDDMYDLIDLCDKVKELKYNLTNRSIVLIAKAELIGDEKILTELSDIEYI